MNLKKYTYISNNKNIDILYNKGLLKIHNKNNNFANIIKLNNINYLEHSNIIYSKLRNNMIFIRTIKDILILS
jgi:hypothetical protein